MNASQPLYDSYDQIRQSRHPPDSRQPAVTLTGHLAAADHDSTSRRLSIDLTSGLVVYL